MQSVARFRLWAFYGLFLSLTGCGGGNGSDALASNNAPTPSGSPTVNSSPSNASTSSAPAGTVPRFAYAAVGSRIRYYAVDANTGQLRNNGFFQAANTVRSLALSPSQAYVYALQKNNSSPDNYSIHTFAVDPRTGALSETGQPVYAGYSSTPPRLRLSASGKFAYAAVQSTLLSYAVDGNTGLPSRVGNAISLPDNVQALAINPAGTFLFAATPSQLFVFRIDPSAGTLTQSGNPQAIPTASGIQIHPNGQLAFLGTGAGVSVYRIDPNSGAWTPQQTLDTGLSNNRVTLDPQGAHAFVSGDAIASGQVGSPQGSVGGQVRAYQIDANTGALSFINAQAGGKGNPAPLRVDASGQYLYAEGIFTNPANNYVYGYLVDTFRIAPNGALSLQNRVRTQGSATDLALVNGDQPVSFAPRFVYAVNQGSNDLSAYRVDASSGALTPLGATVPAGAGPDAIALSPSGRFAYVANYGANSISGYRVNGDTGALTPLGTVAAGSGPRSLAVDPAGRYLFAANYGSGDISAYRIDAASGALSPLGTVATGAAPQAITADPTGTFLFVAGAGGVSVHFIQSSGLPYAAAAPTAAGSQPYALAMDASGSFLYVANREGSVSAYVVPDLNNVIRPVDGAPFASGGSPSAVIGDPSGRFLFTANGSGNSISGFTLDGTAYDGKPTGMAAPFPAGANASGIAIDRAGRFVYVANAAGDNIGGYTMNPDTGALTPMSTPTFPAGVQPVALTVLSGMP